MAIPILGGIVTGIFHGLKKFFFSKTGIFALLGIIGITIVQWAFLSKLTDMIAQQLLVSSFPSGTAGHTAIQFILLCGLDDYVEIVLGALNIKLALAATKIRFTPGQLNLPF